MHDTHARRITHPTWDRAALLLILVIGTWLRFQNIDDIEYNIDQVYPIWQALQTLDTGALPLAGQGTSVLFANPPLTGYFYVPLIALAREPVAAYVLTLMLNSLAIWLAYRGLRWLLGRYPALVGAFLFAANPWIIEDSRRTWVQALAPFFVTLIFWALVPVLTGQTRHPRRRTLIALVGLALFAHTYLLAYALIAPVAVLIVLFWRRIPKRQLLYGGTVFALLMALYAAGLVRQWDQTSSRAGEFASGEARLSSEALDHALRLVTGGGYADVRGLGAPQDDASQRQTITKIIHILWALMIAAGIAFAIRALLRPQHPQQRAAALILLLWYLLPVAMMSYVARVVHPFYLLLSVPAGHGLAAWGATAIGTVFAPNRVQHVQPAPPSTSPYAHWWGVLVVALIATGTINGLNTLRFAQNTAHVPGEDLPGTLPLGEATALGTRIAAARDPGMAVLSPMDEWTPQTLAGHALRTERLTGIDRATIVPEHGAIAVTIARHYDTPMPPPPHAEPAGPPLLLDDNAVIMLWRSTPDALTIAHPVVAPSDIDVTFTGWTLDGDLVPGEEAALDLFFRVNALHPDRGVWAFAPFAHLYDASGARRAVFDGAVIPALTWQPGDTLVYRMPLAVPQDATGPFSVRVGLFDAVRTREDGTQGINAIFQVPLGDGGAIEWRADIEILAGDAR